MSQNKTEVTFSNRTILRVIGMIVLTLLVLRFVSNISHQLELIFIAFFLSMALNPAVSWIAHHLRLKTRAVATGIAYIAVVLVLGVFAVLVFPPLVRETIDFVRQAPETISSLNDESSPAGRIVKRYKLQETVNGLSANIRDRTKNIQEPVISTAGRIGSMLISILTVFVLTFMMLVEGPMLLKRYWQMHPARRLEHDREIIHRMYKIVTSYVNGQVLIAAIAALFAMTMLIISSTLFNVSLNVVALGGIVFLFGLIPLIGNTLAAIMVTLVCLLSSWGLAIVAIIYFLLYQQIENVTLQPYIQAKNNELTPLLVFTSALLGAGLGGILGAFVAIPAAGCAKILLMDYLKTKKLNNNSI